MAGDAAVVHFASGMSGDAIAFGRDARGFVVINRSSGPWTASLQTGLAAGQYADVLGTLGNVTVGSDGTASVTVPSMKAAAIHTESLLAVSI